MKAFLISLLILVLASCSSDTNVPPDILSQPRMQAVLWDVIRTDEFVLNYVKNDSLHNKLDERSRLYESVFRIHQTNRDQFKRSIIFYSGHPDLLKVIFDSLENRRNSINEEMHKRPFSVDTSRKKPAFTDSLRKRPLLIDSVRRRLGKPDSTHRLKRAKLSLRK